MKPNRFLAIALAAMALTACDKDGDTIYIDQVTDAEIDGTNTDIVLDKDLLDALALTVYWNANGNITLSDPQVAAPSYAVTNVVQMAADEAFDNMVEETMADGVYTRQFTCRELNSVVSRLGFEGGVRTPLYIRVRSTVGDNISPRYSNIIKLNVTPYFIDMTVGMVLDASQADTGRTLISPDANGIYTGFIGAAAWENWWLREGNSTIWGNDGVTGTAFVLGNSTTGNDIWNFWYPGIGGCYYTVVDTKANQWSALLIPEITLGGDLSGAMTFDRKANKWTYTFTSAAASTVSVTLSATGKQYDVNTGTDDAAAVDTPVAFGGVADALTFGTAAAQPISVSIPAGETTLVLDLSNPAALTLSAGQGGPAPVETVAPLLYLSGIYGEWTFDWYLKLYNEDNRTYGGVLPVDSEWGYRMYTEPDAWDDFYTMVEGGNGFEGKLTKEGDGNITAPDPGMYLFDVSLGDMRYKLYPVASVSYTGLNDDWSLTPMQPGDTPGVYTATVTKSANTPWGVKIVINDNWDLFFGGNGTPGELVLFHDGFEGDNDLANGTYTLTVDLAKGTYTYSE
ncbi:MAG: DUF5114 domain-containing protein [Bacteroidales bacterium]|nr:DUF5114 domain-containing protein [Bacteroidales bacterium]